MLCRILWISLTFRYWVLQDLLFQFHLLVLSSAGSSGSVLPSVIEFSRTLWFSLTFWYWVLQDPLVQSHILVLSSSGSSGSVSPFSIEFCRILWFSLTFWYGALQDPLFQSHLLVLSSAGSSVPVSLLVLGSAGSSGPVSPSGIEFSRILWFSLTIWYWVQQDPLVQSHFLILSSAGYSGSVSPSGIEFSRILWFSLTFWYWVQQDPLIRSPASGNSSPSHLIIKIIGSSRPGGNIIYGARWTDENRERPVGKKSKMRGFLLGGNWISGVETLTWTREGSGPPLMGIRGFYFIHSQEGAYIIESILINLIYGHW